MPAIQEEIHRLVIHLKQQLESNEPIDLKELADLCSLRKALETH